MTAQELLNRGMEYINACEMDRYEYRDSSPEMFFERGLELRAMQDMLDYLTECLEDEAE